MLGCSKSDEAATEPDPKPERTPDPKPEAAAESETRIEPTAELLAAVRDNGHGLPATVGADVYEQVLEQTRAEIEGPLSGSVGPMAAWATASPHPDVLRFFTKLPPLLNVRSTGVTQAYLIAESVRDKSGTEVLDKKDLPPQFGTLLFDTELPEAKPMTHEVIDRFVDLPSNSPVLYGYFPLVALTRELALDEISEIDVTLELLLPLDVTIVELGADKTTAEHAGATIHANYGTPTANEVTLEVTSPKLRYFGLAAFDADHKPLECRESGSWGDVEVTRNDAGKVVTREWKGDASLFLECPKLPASISVALASEVLVKHYEATLKR
ncbi:hypothetical protein DB30_04424 [Enhygromyxa salina]|uniref:Uncharacterized protein n=1 Tax=Enhygromyxa salina TaxID=215803 RepID=A0A0C2CZV4_9BACT|nr:hypothetical protein DB30_04424 [Enhygromyxa salina]